MAAGRVLITGGNGFLGANLTRALLAAGEEVHLLLRPGSDPWRLAGLAGRYTAHAGDLMDPASLRRAAAAARPEVVYHLAAQGVSPAQSARSAVLATSFLGTANLLEALADQDYRAFVHAGTPWECGVRDGAIAEDDALAPHNDYAVAKAAALLLCRAEAGAGRPVVAVRVFSAYGPWESPGRLVPYVMGCCWRGEPPRVSAGGQVRDFIHVDDVVDLLRTAAGHAAGEARTLHAAGGRGHTVGDMVETILAVGGGGLRAVYGAERLRPGEPARCVADVRRTAARTGWRARLDLRAGVERTWAWFQGRAA